MKSKSSCCCFVALLLDPAIRIEQEGLGDGIDDALRVFGERDVDAGRSLDLTHLAEQDVEHDAIDGIVSAVEQAGFDLGGLLAEAVDPTFALFKPVRVPRKIVVEDGGKEILEVDALAEAIGGDQDAGFVARHLGDALAADIVRVFAGDNVQVELRKFLSERGPEVRAEILRGLDVAAEDDGVKPFLEPVFEDDRGGEEFRSSWMLPSFSSRSANWPAGGADVRTSRLVRRPESGCCRLEAIVQVADRIFGFASRPLEWRVTSDSRMPASGSRRDSAF